MTGLMDFEIFEIWILFCLVILTGGTIITLHIIGQIFKNAREDTDPLNDYVAAMHAHDKEEAED